MILFLQKSTPHLLAPVVLADRLRIKEQSHPLQGVKVGISKLLTRTVKKLVRTPSSSPPAAYIDTARPAPTRTSPARPQPFRGEFNRTDTKKQESE